MKSIAYSLFIECIKNAICIDYKGLFLRKGVLIELRTL